MQIKLPMLLAAVGFLSLPTPSYGQLEFNELFRDANPEFMIQITTYRIHHVYEEGDQLSLKVSVSQDAYLHIFNVTPEGHVRQLVPVEGATPVKLTGGDVHTFPQDFAIEVVPPFGAEQIWCLATDRPVDLTTDNPNSRFGAFMSTMTANERGESATPLQASLLKAFLVREQQQEPTSNWSGQAINVISVPRFESGPTNSQNNSQESGAGKRTGQRIFVGICPLRTDDHVRALESLAEAYAEWGFSTQLLTGCDATKDGVTQLLSQLAKETAAGDIVCIHYHGQLLSIAEESPKNAENSPVSRGWLMFDSDANNPRSLLTEERLATAVSFLPKRRVLLTADMQPVHRERRGSDTPLSESSDRFEITDHLVADSQGSFVSMMITHPATEDSAEENSISFKNSNTPHSLPGSLRDVLTEMLGQTGCRSLLEVANAVLNSSAVGDGSVRWTATADSQIELAEVRRHQEE